MFNNWSPLQIILLMVGLMSGVLSIVREALGIWRGESISQRSLFWHCVVIAFLLSMGILVWQKSSQIDGLEKQLDELSKPQFEIAHGTAAVLKGTAEYTKVTEPRTFIVLPVTVFNHGAPSVIRDIGMTVRFPNGEELTGKPYLPKNPEMSLPGPKGEISFPTSSSLFIKGASPIPMGGQADGFVMFELPAGLMEKIAETADWMELTIIDVNKKRYSIRLPRNAVPTGEF